jgi:regulator of sigma E protease
MDVMTFSIGFGPVLYSFQRGGVTYRIGIIPFGGYVKIRGMEEDSDNEDSYYKKKPYQRLLMVLAGPFVNIVFAFIGFSAIYFCGGFLKDSVDSTTLVGMVDPASQTFVMGLKPGDRIESINGEKVIGRKDLFFHTILQAKQSRICGESINYKTREKNFFDFTVEPVKQTWNGYEIQSLGLSCPASYLIFNSKRINGSPFVENSSMKNSSIMDLDRIVWVNGELIFSKEQLNHILQQNSCLVTVLRKGEIKVVKAIKKKLSELGFTLAEKEDIQDIKFDANIAFSTDVEFIDCIFDQDGIVYSLKDSSSPFEVEDKIIAVDGIKTIFGSDILKLLQKRHVVGIVSHANFNPIESKEQDALFFNEFSMESLDKVIHQIGVTSYQASFENLRLLKPFEPIEIEFNGQIHYRMGVHLHDRQVIVNPDPFTQTWSTFKEMGKILHHLTKGDLSPKFLSGPVGIVGAMQKGWSDGFKDGLFWLSTISLNLGVMNLIPIPVLDGGHVVFTVFEMVTKRRINRKLMERLLVPFVLFFIGLAIFTTFHDLQKIFSFIR